MNYWQTQHFILYYYFLVVLKLYMCKYKWLQIVNGVWFLKSKNIFVDSKKQSNTSKRCGYSKRIKPWHDNNILDWIWKNTRKIMSNYKALWDLFSPKGFMFIILLQQWVPLQSHSRACKPRNISISMSKER